MDQCFSLVLVCIAYICPLIEQIQIEVVSASFHSAAPGTCRDPTSVVPQLSTPQNVPELYFRGFSLTKRPEKFTRCLEDDERWDLVFTVPAELQLMLFQYQSCHLNDESMNIELVKCSVHKTILQGYITTE
ncbi:hypothetical protein BDQ17DRAFT_1306143 [Cyathus striatus]|nr:hypothetical protein BDQ17DRAFT_1306143 [Cyathus striatus]